MQRPATKQPDFHPASAETKAPVCPRCGSDALNKNGRIASGKQRYRCLVCERQFVHPTKEKLSFPRPTCPACGKAMHVYARENGIVRFRCAAYPACRTYAKSAIPNSSRPRSSPS